MYLGSVNKSVLGLILVLPFVFWLEALCLAKIQITDQQNVPDMPLKHTEKVIQKINNKDGTSRVLSAQSLSSFCV